MAFNIGLSGIRAASTDLSVTGNNIANASTTGFKSSRTEFGDLYTTSLLGSGKAPVGSGVQVSNIRQEFSQGSISATDNVLDLAIDGNGFFVLDNQGIKTYSRSGIFSLDKEGYVVANNGSRLQGFMANSNGVVSGVIKDLQIEVANQAPRLTSVVNTQLNLDAGQKVLQEQGTTVSTTGLAIGSVDSGIISSTASTLAAAGQPTTAGTPASLSFSGDLATIAATGYGAISLDIDPGDGSGASTVTLTGGAAGGTTSDIIDDVQSALNNTFGSQQFVASEGSNGELVISRAGYGATTGTAFVVNNTTDWDTAFGANTGVVNGTAGSLLFVGNNPLTVDFTSVPGTSTTTRTTATPPLTMVGSTTGEFANLTANSIYGTQDFSASGGNVAAFTLAVGSGSTYPIVLSENTWTGSAPSSFNSVTTNEVIAEINAQIASYTATPDVVAVNNSGRIEFQVQAPAERGDYVQLADNSTTSVNLDLADLGFAVSNRFDPGVPPVLANNEFQLEVTSTTGEAAGPFTITIPTGTYASLDDLSNAIQQQIDVFIGAAGIADKVSVDAVGGQLVFTNLNTGSGEGIELYSTAAEPQALAALGFDSLFTVNGTDEIDRSNSFRINLTAPAPDTEGRSGSVVVSLNQEFRSVQEMASAINAQLNSQDADSYIGVQAFAAEVVPNTTPPQYKLEFRATEAGEESIISVTNITASGADISDEELFAALQVNPADSDLLTLGIEGVNNGYPETTATLVAPDGSETELLFPKYSEANEIVALLNQQPGITATASTQMTLPVAGYNSPGNDMQLTLNGQTLTSTSLSALADEINSYSETTLPGFSAEINDAGDLVINNAIGRDITLEMDSGVDSDSLIVLGSNLSSPAVLGGSASGPKAASVGGTVDIVLNEGYGLKDPNPALSGIFGTLSDSEFSPYVLNVFDPADPDTYNHATSLSVYDSQGNAHVMTQYFVKEPSTSGIGSGSSGDTEWAMYVMIDGKDVGDPDPTLDFPQNLEPTRARYTMYFNQDGSIDTTATGDLYVTNWDPLDSDGERNGALGSVNVLEGGLPLTDPATSSNFRIDLDGTTQYGASFSVNQVSQNGYTTGRLTGLAIDTDGIIFAQFSNGQSQTLGQVALANFTNPEGLTPVGSTGWSESYDSGVPTIGSPRTASLGQIRSSALEESNVDLSEQLVRLIVAQRNFQASAKTIETSDQVTQSILNI
ncbi:flagellar hook-basal body complex protein [Parathalassolituus penaei]|uniref:Flagellar hook protein FlgE n=1 Tax=Parathalassolituus penaei TaxID=2997323 RepID=A0A9X3EFQ8_9GAMM|nr:flagellar hook-basal body complex protein [Parathalassolituus penaei]MCY0965899.1 flagellar hook-basal body complex protein [Parathalassolituus penaei]